MRKYFVILISFIVAGCTSMGSAMLIGGSVVQDYKPSKIVATYKPLGNMPDGTQFYLIEMRGRLAMFREDSDGSGMIYEKHWTDKGNDYFAAAFFGNGPAYIAFVPSDRSLEGGLFIYEHGSYEGGPPGDRKRPTPYNPKSEPDFRLIPQL